ncbi:hypothetical protein COO91_07409 [Nostoc flagelliforme CCNUN1]|uniref:Uncharacterized protein n=1 Tax=Nostoc flagelliforme CCNUN1 TaxID=2038116 RepID=A0A2K8T110_9NOSO|nr:hypothetical protein COO91_07409 [Nostoc flagelliforme CCNUN1]
MSKVKKQGSRKQGAGEKNQQKSGCCSQPRKELEQRCFRLKRGLYLSPCSLPPAPCLL